MKTRKEAREERKERQERKEEQVEKEENQLKEWCRDDAKLYDFLSKTLYLNPLVGISNKGLDILTEEVVTNGDFRPAVDKAIFEGSQKPEERERYIKIIQDLAAKTIYAAEGEMEEAEREGLTDRAVFLKRRIEKSKFMSERAEGIINVAAKFYNKKMVELSRIEARKEEIREAQR
jgi:3-methyladenine DNA glycosylase/8-oxoguanine DNA glycosylase